jgi:hypothetical protein
MAVLFSISALIFMLTRIPQSKCSIKQAFFRIKEQKYLANHVIETKQNMQRASYSVVYIALEMNHAHQ